MPRTLVRTTACVGADWAAALEPPDDPAWRLEAPGFQPALEHEVETRVAISNGLLGVRGALEQPTSASRPRTYIAGLFDTPPGDPAIPALVSGPDWLWLLVLVDGAPLAFETGATLAFSRTLDIRRGTLISAWRWRDSTGHVVQLRTLRFVSLADRRLAVQIAWIAVEQPLAFTLEARLDVSGNRLRLASADQLIPRPEGGSL